MNNKWNKIIYKLWSPIYDKIFNSGSFYRARRQIFNEFNFYNGQKILFVGVGTGAELELIKHNELHITAIDYSKDMLNKAKDKFKDSSIVFLEMDAQEMDFNDFQFDCVVGSLILSVVPDADKCFREMIRVLKSDGQILLFDKFSSKNEMLSLTKILIRPIVKVLGTDIGLNFEELYKKNLQVVDLKENQPVMFNGMYRKILLNKRITGTL